MLQVLDHLCTHRIEPGKGCCEGQGLHALGRFKGHMLCDSATHGATDNMCFFDSQFFHKPKGRICQISRSGGFGNKGTVAGTGVVKRDDPVFVLPGCNLRKPGSVVSGKPVDQ